MGRIKQYFKIYESEETRAVFEQNEFEANRLSLMVIVACALILITSWLLSFTGVFKIVQYRMNVLAIQGLIELAVPIVFYIIYKGRKRWLKYIMLFSLLLVCTRLFSILNHNVILIMILPVLLSSRYFSKGLTVMISILSVLLLAAASLTTVFFGIIDLNLYPSPEDGTIILIKESLRASVIALGVDTSKTALYMMVNGFIPRMLVFIVISFISVFIAKHGHEMVLKQDKISRASANVKADLDTATKIQKSMVPNVFPAFPERKEFDIFAAMYPAKEVGGDFYDFFLIDENHLAMVIADVSGKGIPASLFMMASKILISDRTLMGGTPAEILEFVNKRICSNNKAEMFISVWLGILDIKSGKVIASNAGHEYPAICKKDGEFEILKDKHGFVVGGMDFVKYQDYEFTLHNGDTLFLYTDGIPEANNSDEELFGSERMLEALNMKSGCTSKEIISNVKSEVDKFVGNSVKFDDLTMLCIKYYGEDEE